MGKVEYNAFHGRGTREELLETALDRCYPTAEGMTGEGLAEKRDRIGVGIDGGHAFGSTNVGDRRREGPDTATEVVHALTGSHLFRHPGVFPGESRGKIGPLEVDLELHSVLFVTGAPGAGAGDTLDLPPTLGPMDSVVDTDQPDAGYETKQGLADRLPSWLELRRDSDQNDVPDDVERSG